MKFPLLAAVAVCFSMPLLFPAPASTVRSSDEFAALAVVLGPGTHELGPERLEVSGTDTLRVRVTGIRPLSPPRDPRVAAFSLHPHSAVFLVLPEVSP